MLTIESVRELYGATQRDELGRYYAKELGQDRSYVFTRDGENICFTCEGVVRWNEFHTLCGKAGA